MLEKAGLVEWDIDAQRRPRRLNATNMAAAVDFLNEFKRFWGSRFDQLSNVLETLKQEDKEE